MNGHRFLGRSLRSLATMVAAGRLAVRADGRRPDPAGDHHLGSVRGEPRTLRGPGGAPIYTEWFPSGRGGRGTLVLTHGLCLTEAVWHYQKQDLPGGPFDVVTWDLPGHGHSGLPPSRGFTQEVALDALHRVVREYDDGEGVVVAGHSLGGVLTLRYLATRASEVAQHVRGAGLVSTPMLHFARSVAGRWPGAGAEARALAAAFRTFVESGIVDRYLARDVGREGPSLSYRVVRVGFGRDPSPTHVRYIRDAIASVPPEVRAAAFETMTGYDIRPDLPSITQPVLVVIGGRDRLVNPSESKDLAARLPAAETLLLPDAGHAPFLEMPEIFNERLTAFAADLLGGRRVGAEPA